MTLPTLNNKHMNGISASPKSSLVLRPCPEVSVGDFTVTCCRSSPCWFTATALVWFLTTRLGLR